LHAKRAVGPQYLEATIPKINVRAVPDDIAQRDAQHTTRLRVLIAAVYNFLTHVPSNESKAASTQDFMLCKRQIQ